MDEATAKYGEHDETTFGRNRKVRLHSLVIPAKRMQINKQGTRRNAMSGAGLAEAAPQRESQVGAARVRLEEQIGQAEKAVRNLFARIELVTKPTVPEPPDAKTGEPIEVDSVALAAWINTNTNRVKLLVHDIANTTNRVEL